MKLRDIFESRLDDITHQWDVADYQLTHITNVYDKLKAEMGVQRASEFTPPDRSKYFTIVLGVVAYFVLDTPKNRIMADRCEKLYQRYASKWNETEDLRATHKEIFFNRKKLKRNCMKMLQEMTLFTKIWRMLLNE